MMPTMLATYRVIGSLLVVGFVVRYIRNEQRARLARDRAIADETGKRVAPWADWQRWRQGIIESEFADGV